MAAGWKTISSECWKTNPPKKAFLILREMIKQHTVRMPLSALLKSALLTDEDIQVLLIKL